MRWAGNAAGMTDIKMHTKYWLESLKGRDNSEQLVTDGRIILKRHLGKWCWNTCIGIIWFRIRTVEVNFFVP
jgi:hypothetical protein